MGGKHILPYELDAFIEQYVELKFNFAAAAKAIGRTARGVRDHMRANEEFAARVRDVRHDMAGAVLAEAYRRAVEGHEQTHVTKDGREFTTTEYSDTLLLQLLKSLMPEFGDKTKLELSNPDGSLQASDSQIAARVASILAVAEARKARGEIIDAEIVEPAALPPPNNEDLV